MEQWPTEPRPAIDLTHHLSSQARARHVSPLKGLQKYIGDGDTIKLAGGMPDPSYFPFESITVHALPHDSLGGASPSASARTGLFAWIWSFFGSVEKKNTKFSVPKYPAKPSDINLATALQYTPATGIKQIQDFVRDFTARVFKPAYADWQTLIDNGNTDGICRSVSSLCDAGEAILVEEWTYPSMLATAVPLSVSTVPMPVDGEGISSVALEKMLAEWDEQARGAKRPHVIYTVPIGQNPTGATMGIERKKAIYAICVKYDIVIIEDDPYFFLQEGTWVPAEERARNAALARRIEADPEAFFGGGTTKGDLARAKAALRPAVCADDENERFINSLAPSFISIDYQGRVVRLDSFSKTIAPGSRLGWITASPQLIERFERFGETASQAPSGLSQALVAQLVAVHWGAPRFLTWLRGLQAQYTARRDACVDALCAAFDVRRDVDPAAVAAFGAGVRPYVYTAHLKQRSGGGGDDDDGRSKLRPRVFSFIPPSSGMFVWVKFHVRDNNNNNNNNNGSDKGEKSKESLEQRLWMDLAENGLLVVPGWFFSPIAAGEIPPATGDEEDARFRISFSMGTDENMKKGMDVLAKVLEQWVAE